MEMYVEAGRGYVPSEMLKHAEVPVGTIFLDALFSPVLDVNFVRMVPVVEFICSAGTVC